MPNLTRLIYVSRANFKAANESSGIEPTVARILMQSRLNNPKKSIGGVLYFGDGCFFQCLEGESDAVNALIARIMPDERHSDVQILKVIPIKQRIFKNWSMKYVPLEKDVSVLLQRHKMESFDPYKFSDDLIDEFIELFGHIADPGSKPDQDYVDRPQKSSGTWRRILGFFGAKS